MKLPDTKAVLSALWTDRFTVTEYQEVDKPNGSTGLFEVITVLDEPCKLSFSSLSVTDATDDKAPLTQAVKLFCGKEHDIKAGSKITVVRDGVPRDYKQSGVPGIFGSHQEIVLIPYADNA